MIALLLSTFSFSQQNTNKHYKCMKLTTCKNVQGTNYNFKSHDKLRQVDYFIARLRQIQRHGVTPSL